MGMQSFVKAVRGGRARLARSGVAVVAAAVLLVAGGLVLTNGARADRQLDLSDGSMWLGSTRVPAVSLFDSTGTSAAALSLPATLATGTDDFRLEHGGGHTFVVNDTSGAVARIDATTWQLSVPTRLWNAGEDVELAVGADSLFVVREGSITEIDARTLAKVADHTLGFAPHAAVVDEDGELVVSARDDGTRMRRYAGDGSHTELDGPTGPVDLVRAGRAVAGLTPDGRVWVDGTGVTCDLDLVVGAGKAIGGGPTHLAVVADTGNLVIWDGVEGGCPNESAALSVPSGSYGAPVLNETWGAVVDRDRPAVVVFDLEQPSIVAQQRIDGAEPGPIELLGEGSAIWFNDPTSSLGGVVKPNGDLEIKDKYERDGDGVVNLPTFEVAGTTQGRQGVVDPGPTEPPDTSQATTDTTEAPPVDPVGPEPTTPTTEQEQTATTESGPAPTIQVEETTTTTGGEGTTTTRVAALDVRIAVSASEIVIGDSITFEARVENGNPSTFEWAFSPDDGVDWQNGQPRFTKRFDAEGDVVVSLRACDGELCGQGRAVIGVVADQTAVALEASFTDPGIAVVGEAIRFNDTSQGEPDGRTWTFEGGDPASSADRAPSVTWSTPGTYTVTLVISRGAEENVATRSVRVEPAAVTPTLEVSCSPRTIGVGDEASCSVLDRQLWKDIRWDVTGGLELSGRTGPDVRVTGTASGAGRVIVVATSTTTSDEATDEVNLTVEALAAPAITITGATTIDEGASVTFGVGNSGGPIETHRWRVDGVDQAATGSSLTVDGLAAGDHTIQLDVSGPGGSDSDTHVVRVNPTAGEITLSNVSVNPRRFDNRDDYWFADVTFTSSECTSAQYVYETNGHNQAHTTSACETNHSVVLGQDNFDRILGASTYSLTITATSPDGRTARRTVTFQTQGTRDDPGQPGDTPGGLAHSGFTVTNRTDTQVWMSLQTGNCSNSQWVIKTLDGTTVNTQARASYPNPDPATGGECWASQQQRAGEPIWGAQQPLSPGTSYTVTITSIDNYGDTVTSSYNISTTGTPVDTAVSNIQWVQGSASSQTCWVRPFVTYSVTWSGPGDANVVWFTGGVGFHGSHGAGQGSAPLSFDFEDSQLGTKTMYVEINGVRGPDHQVTVSGSGCNDGDSDDQPDFRDNCPAVSNADQADNDGDGIGNACDPTPDGDAPDADGDGVADASDNCVNDSNTDQADNDGDGIGNACDPTPDGDAPDADGDGVADASDNCVNDSNTDQADNDGDGIGNACDPTPDGDPPADPDEGSGDGT